MLTSRNALLALRRWIAQRRPDLIKSNGGGANAILVRGDQIAAHAALRLRWRPERRMLHAVHLTGAGIWVANVHATANPKLLARADMVRCGETLARWAGAAPVLLGGDANVPDPAVPGFADVGGHRIDRFLTRGGLVVTSPARTLERDSLSDHAPVLTRTASRSLRVVMRRLLPALALLVLLAGCGSSDSDGDAGTAATLSPRYPHLR